MNTIPGTPPSLDTLVRRAQDGDVDAYRQIVDATQRMVVALIRTVLRDPALAEDATQETYVRAFKRMRDVQDPAAFPGWLRRVAITVAMNLRRAQRRSFLRLDDVPEAPVREDHEDGWPRCSRRGQQPRRPFADARWTT